MGLTLTLSTFTIPIHWYNCLFWGTNTKRMNIFIRMENNRGLEKKKQFQEKKIQNNFQN
jgi:hypothetical protein